MPTQYMTPRSLFDPLHLAAYVTWIAVLAGALGTSAAATPWLPADAWIWIICVTFLASFLGCHFLDRERHSLARNVFLAVEAAAALALSAISRDGAAPTLLIIVMAQLAPRTPQRATIAIATIINVLLYFELRYVWHMGSPVLGVLLYGAFQAFAAMVSVYAFRAEQASAALAQVNANLVATRSLLAESARDAERLKLARELHDVAGHKLTALKLNLAALARDPRLGEVEGVALCAQLADELLGDIRGVVRQMRAHEGLHLDAALRALAAPLTGLRVHLSIAPGAHVDSVEQAEAIVRAVQEALTNAARHAHANQVWVALARDGDRLTIDIRDDGRGAEAPRLGSGLTGMRERIEALGGELALRAPEDGGFGLHVWLPAKGVA